MAAVDAYVTEKAINFYKTNGFKFFPNEEERCEEILKEGSKTDENPRWFDLFRAKADID